MQNSRWALSVPATTLDTEDNDASDATDSCFSSCVMGINIHVHTYNIGQYSIVFWEYTISTEQYSKNCAIKQPIIITWCISSGEISLI